MRYPLKLTAPLRDYLWGGQRLKQEYGKQSELPKIAESWELSCHKDGTSVIANGEAAGMLLSDYIEQQGITEEETEKALEESAQQVFNTEFSGAGNPG